MGCSTSKLDDEEAVQLCKDRKKFIRQAVEHRAKFASGHIAYIQAMKRVSSALREYVDGDEPREFLLDSFTTPVFTPIKKTSPGFISISPDSFSVTPFRSETNSSYKINYFKSGGNSSVSVEERPPHSPETYRVEAYSPIRHFGMDSMFAMQSSPMGTSFFQSSVDQGMLDDENAELQQVREEEGIPELEEETEHEDIDDRLTNKEESGKFNVNIEREEVVVEDVDDSDDSDCDCETDGGHEPEKHVQELPSQEKESIELAKAQNRPTSMAEVIKDLEDQFVAACNAAGEMSSILEASRACYSSSSNDLSAMKMLNPVALFRSASSRSSSARFLVSASTSREESYESGSDLSEESCIWSHQSTLDRLYAWEKKLYQEVRAGERVRIQYEKKFAQLRNQDVKGDDPSFVDKTRAAMRDLDTQIKVSIHSVEAISKRIETLRDEELEPQLLELVHGLSRMWKVMAECHQLQKRTLDEAKILLAGTPSKLSGTKKYTIMSPSEPHRLARSAANLETELRNWRACFDSWIVSQRSYIHALSGWLLRCVRPDPGTKLPFSPRRSLGAPPIFNICIQWSRFLDAVQEAPVLDGMDFFVAGVGSLYAQQLREDSRRQSGGSKRFGPEIVGNMEVVEAGRFEDEVMTAEKMAEVAIRVLCAGMSVAVSALTEFAVSSADGYSDLIKQLENGKQSLHGTEK
ncbi:protein ALTERED PHOSPHATE STARVATION RESPONSE 1 [Sesamum angolense]|uniref:Protein ALTERED PHOSPHATE STARVATION RESPONSE 1 n=1 Tax=Sesamum angolense TaxID=2727404 RepID=A0AAE1WEN0_9LAMI|nr:protein ALTERED PHOSPHATE STARVATION RESPONSE 1 [Sesamum angolense]